MAILTKKSKVVILTICLFFLLTSVSYSAVRLKDIAHVQGVRDNQLIGYGLVVGLNGTGDGSSAAFTYKSIVSMLERIGMTISESEISVKNVAAVMVTAKLPPFVREGSRIDCTVSSLGNATNLQGGVLLMTPLQAADGKVYAVAQGSVSMGGFNVGDGGSGGSTVQKNHPTVGRIPQGALIEREVASHFSSEGKINIVLKEADFTTSTRVAAAINAELIEDKEVDNQNLYAYAQDAATVRVKIPETYQQNLISLISRLEKVDVIPDSIARIVINERTGTIVAGENVKISTVAVSHGNLTIEITSKYMISQPQPFSYTGSTESVTEQETFVEEEEARLVVLNQGVNIGEVATALNALGVTPRDMIAIFQAMKEAGALQAELIIM